MACVADCLNLSPCMPLPLLVSLVPETLGLNVMSCLHTQCRSLCSKQAERIKVKVKVKAHAHFDTSQLPRPPAA